MVICLFLNSIRRFHTSRNDGVNIYANRLMMASFFVGLGPGSPGHVPSGGLHILCLPGSNHGGSLSTQDIFKVGGPYDMENLTTFRGGSGGDATLSLSVFLFFLFVPVFLSSLSPTF